MDKNSLMIVNDVIYTLHACTSLAEIKSGFLPRLKMTVPYSYASLLLRDADENADTVRLSSPICVPDSFAEAEDEYIKVADQDHLLWLLHARQPQIIRESELLNEQQRLSSPLYVHCYRQFDVYDSLQYASVYQERLLGILTLFRTREMGTFSADEAFLMNAIGMHLNLVLFRLSQSRQEHGDLKQTMEALQTQYHLTPRELEIAQQVFLFRDNDEIAAALGIRSNTLQKHLQNIFRKTNVASRWELLRLGYGVQ